MRQSHHDTHGQTRQHEHSDDLRHAHHDPRHRCVPSPAGGPQREFWRDLKPIEQVFRPGALPEAYIKNAPTDDERFYVPFSKTVGSRPLWISPSQNRWCDVLYARRAGLVNRHYHPQQVFAYTISGKWGYLEHDWVATAGDWVYEAPGEAHTLVPALLELHEQGRFPFTDLIEYFPLEESNHAIAASHHGEVIKPVIRMT